MKKLSIIGRFFTPLAMVVFLTYEISTSMNPGGLWQYFIVIGAAGTAIGIEAIGILSGHALEGYWQSSKKSRAVTSLIMLIIYTAVSMYVMRNNETLRPIPIIAAVVYIVSALVESLEVQKETTDETAVYEREQDRLDRDLERKQKIADMRLKHEERLARIEAKKTSQPATGQRRDIPVSNGHLPGDFRLLTAQQKEQMKDLSTGELAQMADISDSTARRWKRQIAANGYHK